MDDAALAVTRAAPLPPAPRPFTRLSGLNPKETLMKYRNEERTFKDPVCGMSVSRTTAIDELRYLGKIYYFCAGTCRQAFEAEPEKFIRYHRQHGLRQR